MVSFRGRLTPADSRTVLVLPVEIPPGVRQMRIDLAYAPRAVDDRAAALDLVRTVLGRLPSQAWPEEVLARFWPLRNLLNLTVFDPRGRFRGRWDRNRPAQRSTAVVAEARSDAGMIDGALLPGPWRLCLEVHQILTPVDYALTVEWGAELPGPDAGEGLGPARGERAAGVAAGAPGRGEWLAGELHVHSEHSDGAQPVGEIVEALRGAGLEFFALTDHNTTSGLRDLPAGALAVPGLELTTFYGHATCLGVTSFVPWYDGPRIRAFAEMASEVHEAGGLVAVVHPFAPPNPLCAGCRWEYPAFSWHDADLLEIWNGDRDEHAPINEPALRLWDELLTAGRRIVAVAGADLHDVAHLRTKRFARTLVQAATRSVDGILQGLQSGRVVITAGPLVALAVSAGERRWEIGDTAVVRRGARLMIHGRIMEASAQAETFVVLPGRRIPVPSTVDRPVEVDRPGWIRCEVTVDGTIAAVTNPIYVDIA